VELGLSEVKLPGGEVQLKFRSGWIRSAAVTLGGAGLIGLCVAVVNLAQHQPAEVFGLLARWGFWWLLALAGMLILWDLAKLGLAYLGQLAKSVQDTAVAMHRIADRDDRDRDRMITETSFIGQRIQRLTDEMREERVEIRDQLAKQNACIETLVQALRK
jgi:hypothetical protein